MFGKEDSVRVLEFPHEPEYIVRAVNRGNWEFYLGEGVDRSASWQALLANQNVIITQAQSLPTHTPVRLTPRENQVLQLLSSGYTAGQIAVKLHLDVRTIRNYISDMRAKFHAHTNLQIIAKAVALGMVRPDLNDLAD